MHDILHSIPEANNYSRYDKNKQTTAFSNQLKRWSADIDQKR